MEEPIKITVVNQPNAEEAALAERLFEAGFYKRNRFIYHLSRWWDKRLLWVDTMEEYSNLPKSSRNFLGFVYKPFLLRRESFDDFFHLLDRRTLSERSKYLKEHYPIQFFLRETLVQILKRVISKPKYAFIRWKDRVSDFFFPKQKWLCEKIPKKWIDYPELIRISLFAIVVDFVEVGGALNFFEPDAAVEEGQEDSHEFYSGLKECFEYITLDRPALESALNACWREKVVRNYYSEIERIENELSVKDTKYLSWIAANNESMWN